MGIFRKAEKIAAYQPHTTGYSGIYSQSTLPLSIFPDFDHTDFPVGDREALSVPAVYRAVALYSSVISRLPLRGAPFLTRHDNGAITPGLTLATLVQDLMLHGRAVLSVTRTPDGEIDNAIRVHPSRWSITPDQHIAIDGKVQPDNAVVFFSGLMPYGILDAARHSIRQYTSMCNTINNRTAAPQPATLVRETEASEATPEEIDEAIDNLTETLRNRRGGIVYVPKGVEVEPFGISESSNSLMIEARQAVRTDLANFLTISAALLDGTQTGAGDVYTNALQSKSELLEFSIKTYSEVITDRLSQDDCTPAGNRVSFDYSEWDTVLDAAGNIGAPRQLNQVNEVTTSD